MTHLLFTPVLGVSAIQFAFEKATPEGKITICFLAVVSMLSWTVIITKARQLLAYNPQTQIEAGIRKFVAWFRESRKSDKL